MHRIVSCKTFSCPANFNISPFSLKLKYYNQCATGFETTNYFAPANSLSIDFPYIDTQVEDLPPILEQDTWYKIELCASNFNDNGWNGISDHGELNQCITVNSNYPIMIENIIIDDTPYPAVGNNIILPPGIFLDSDCGVVTFKFLCADTVMEHLQLEFQIKAFWEDCPDCPFVLACPSIDLYTNCPGGGLDTCALSSIRGEIINSSVHGLTTPEGEERAYPCDTITMTAQAVMSENVNVPLTGCYLYQDDIPVVFTEGEAKLKINDVLVETVGLTSSMDNVFEYEFNNYPLVINDFVEVIISVVVVEDPLDNYWQNLELLAIGIGFGDELCKVAVDFTVLDYDINMVETIGGRCCDEKWLASKVPDRIHWRWLL